MKSDEIVKYFQDHFNHRSGWIVIPELKLGVGYKSKTFYKQNDPDCERSIDLFIMNPFISCNIRLAFEIKVSQSDFYREVADPTKRRSAVRFANQFYFVTPAGLLKPKQIPSDSGLIEVDDDFHRIIVQAPWHDNAPTWGIVTAITRRLLNQEQLP